MAKKRNENHINDSIDTLQKDVGEIKKDVETLGKIDAANAVKIENIETNIEEIKKQLENDRVEVKMTYTTNDRFEPVRLIAYGLVGGVLLTVLGAILGIVIVPLF